MMNTLKSMSGAEVGFSDHSHDDHLAIAATAMGACVLEKHVTIDRGMKGPDHHFAMTFDEFGKMVKRVAETHMALGDGVHIAMTPKQQKLRDAVQLKLFSGKKLFQGQHISSQDVCLYRCNQDGIEVGHLSQLQQFNLVRDVEAGEKLCWDMFSVVKTSRE
jgi:sialic acid synthase SpsE